MLTVHTAFYDKDKTVQTAFNYIQSLLSNLLYIGPEDNKEKNM